MTLNTVSSPNVPVNFALLSKEENRMWQNLYNVWSRKKGRNDIRKRYYSLHNRLKDLNISIPPQLKSLDISIGWAAKAVDMLADRSIFNGFTLKDGSNDSELDSILLDNDFKILYDMGTKAEVTHSCSFITVTQGVENEPEVMLNMHSALTAAGVWSFRKKRIDYGFAIADFDDNDPMVPTWVNMFTDKFVIELKFYNKQWHVRHIPHSLGRPLIEPMIYKPSLDRPFGKSKLTRAVMGTIDNAVREAVRTEVASEFFTSPQKYLLGADEGIFGKDANKAKWEAYIGEIFAITTNENGEIPQFGQLSQMSMQPHVDYMRSLAANFAGETNLPVSALGIIHDNPASAEAMNVALEDLIIDAQHLNENNKKSLNNMARMIYAIRENKSFYELDAQHKGVSAHFKNPARPSPVSSADNVVKKASVLDWYSDTSTILEDLGYDDETAQVMLTEKKKIQAQRQIQQAMINNKEQQQQTQDVTNEEEVKPDVADNES